MRSGRSFPISPLFGPPPAQGVFSAFNLARADIIAGLDAASSPALGWNAEVRDGSLQPQHVIRTSDTIVTITLPATATYDISAQETITVTVPASALVLAAPITGSPTFTVDAVAATGRTMSSLAAGGGLAGYGGIAGQGGGLAG